ncbi:hypothetical protein B0H11DRAFT_1908528 [Mycena galericulata]|nr:hypothetical protein B0H11DRAFT_1908528 [Mycena galericulata]
MFLNNQGLSLCMPNGSAGGRRLGLGLSLGRRRGVAEHLAKDYRFGMSSRDCRHGRLRVIRLPPRYYFMGRELGPDRVARNENETRLMIEIGREVVRGLALGIERANNQSCPEENLKKWLAAGCAASRTECCPSQSAGDTTPLRDGGCPRHWRSGSAVEVRTASGSTEKTGLNVIYKRVAYLLESVFQPQDRLNSNERSDPNKGNLYRDPKATSASTPPPLTNNRKAGESNPGKVIRTGTKAANVFRIPHSGIRPVGSVPQMKEKTSLKERMDVIVSILLQIFRPVNYLNAENKTEPGR